MFHQVFIMKVSTAPMDITINEIKAIRTSHQIIEAADKFLRTPTDKGLPKMDNTCLPKVNALISITKSCANGDSRKKQLLDKMLAVLKAQKVNFIFRTSFNDQQLAVDQQSVITKASGIIVARYSSTQNFICR